MQDNHNHNIDNRIKLAELEKIHCEIGELKKSFWKKPQNLITVISVTVGLFLQFALYNKDINKITTEKNSAIRSAQLAKEAERQALSKLEKLKIEIGQQEIHNMLLENETTRKYKEIESWQNELRSKSEFKKGDLILFAAERNLSAMIKLLMRVNIYSRKVLNAAFVKLITLRIVNPSPLQAKQFIEDRLDNIYFLIGHGANINQRGNYGSHVSILSIAALSGDLSLVKNLISLGFDLSDNVHSQFHSFKIMSNAIRSGNLEMVKYFLEQKLVNFSKKPYKSLSSGKSIIEIAAESGSHSLLNYLIVQYPGVKVDYQKLLSAAIESESESSIEVVEKCIFKGAKLDDFNGDIGNLNCLKYLINKKHKLLRDNHLPSKLKMNNLYEAIQLLANNGILDIPKRYNFDGEHKQTLLHIACEKNDNRLVHFLVENGVDINFQRGEDSLTALHIAADKDNEPLVKYLVRNGANPNLVDWEGDTPLYYVYKYNYSLIDFLKQRTDRKYHYQIEKH